VLFAFALSALQKSKEHYVSDDFVIFCGDNVKA